MDRPLTKAEHYQRYVGSRAQIRLVAAIEGRRKLSVTIEDVSEEGVQVRDEASGETLLLSLAQIEKANLIPEL
jgi:ribosome maturation factor RimP